MFATSHDYDLILGEEGKNLSTALLHAVFPTHYLLLYVIFGGSEIGFPTRRQRMWIAGINLKRYVYIGVPLCELHKEPLKEFQSGVALEADDFIGA